MDFLVDAAKQALQGVGQEMMDSSQNAHKGKTRAEGPTGAAGLTQFLGTTQEYDEEAEKVIPGDVKMFSGCKDSQTSADVFDIASFGLPAVDPAEQAGGACTNAMLSCLAKEANISYGDLLIKMRDVLREKKYSQIPQLSSSRQVKLKEENFSPYNPKRNGNTKALLIGINYIGQKGELRGCVNDVKMMKHYLSQQGFDTNQMMILTDDTSYTHGLPTRKNILEGLQWLVRDNKPGDSLFFHYSGHGGQMRDNTGDEKDSMDETMIPSDYKTAGQITDDVIYQLMVVPLQKGAHLVAIFDCCHSGTILDLPYAFAANDAGVSAYQSGGVSTLAANPSFSKEYAIKMMMMVASGLMKGQSMQELAGGAITQFAKQGSGGCCNIA